MSRKWLVGVGTIVLLGLVLACGTTPTGKTNSSTVSTSATSVTAVDGSTPTQAPAPAPPISASTSVPDASGANATTVASPIAEATSVAEATAPAATSAAEAPAGGDIVFGKVVDFSSNGLNSYAATVTNNSQAPKSFTAKATFKKSEDLVGTAVGAVNDILPGQTRAVMLLASSPISDYDSVKVDVDTMISESGSPNAPAAQKITFGKPKVQTSPLGSIDVETTNGDDKTHSYTVQGVFIQNGELVGTATGAVNDIAAGQTKTASLIVQGKAEGDLTILVDALIQ